MGMLLHSQLILAAWDSILSKKECNANYYISETTTHPPIWINFPIYLIGYILDLSIIYKPKLGFLEQCKHCFQEPQQQHIEWE